MEALQAENTCFYLQKNRNGTPSANQVVTAAKAGCGHAVCTLQVHSPSSPCPALSAETEPISKEHCWKCHHLWWGYYAGRSLGHGYVCHRHPSNYPEAVDWKHKTILLCTWLRVLSEVSISAKGYDCLLFVRAFNLLLPENRNCYNDCFAACLQVYIFLICLSGWPSWIVWKALLVPSS